MATEKRIALILTGRQFEGEADAAISPGMACVLSADGNYDPWGGSANGENDEVLIALEDALQAKTIDDAYADGDQLFMCAPLPGDVVLVLVKDGESVAVGDKLIRENNSNSGLYIKTTGSPETEDFKALEACAPSGSNKLCKARRI